MSKKVCVVGMAGAGDMIQACQVTHWVQQKVGIDNVELLCLARDETFEPIKLLFSDQMTVKQHELKEVFGENYQLIHNPIILNDLKKEYSEVIIAVPDLLFRAREFSFDCLKYNCSLQQVVQTKLLCHKYQPEKIIYCAFCNTTTKNYNYSASKQLLETLAVLLPDYKLYVPVLLKWNNEDVLDLEKNAELKNLPSNVLVDYNPTWERALTFMSKSLYNICLDSLPYHCSFQFGSPRLLLDPRFDYAESLKWIARWRNGIGLHDSIPIFTDYQRVAQVVATNIRIPQTQLIPRNVVLNNLNVDWARELLLKF